ncbi:MAG: hypothetical protein IJO43_03555 [Bacilli bacterium]|nr:hypothetical protein [Bacilli bacterium]
MIEIGKTKIIEKKEQTKSNILYLCENKCICSFYDSIKCLPFCKIVEKNRIEGLSLISYDAYVVSMSIFLQKDEKITEVIDEIISSKKPVIIVYNSGYFDSFSGYTYLKNKFNISFENKDCSIIENSYDEYLPYDRNGYALSMLFSDGFGKAFVKNTKNCYIFRKENVSVIHDVKPTKYGAENKFTEQKSTLLLNLLRLPQSAVVPKWVDDIKILDDIKLEEEIYDIEEKIEDLKKQKKEKIDNLMQNSEYKKVLYTTGDELVQVVKKILSEMLNVEINIINDIDEKKEDLSFVLDNKNILVEVKGVNTPIKRQYVSQAQNHIEDDAVIKEIDDDDINKYYKALLIVNPYIKDPVKDRVKKDFYGVSVKQEIEHKKVCTLDTITFLSLYQKYKDNQESIDLKDIILNSNYNEPDFSILDK